MNGDEELDEVTLLTDVEIQEISLVTRPANQHALVALWKSDTEDDMSDALDLTDFELPDEVFTYIDGLERQVQTLTAKIDQVEAELAKDDSDSEDLLKGADPALIELVKGLQEKAEQAEMVAKAEADHRQEREWVAKMAATYPNLPSEEDKVARMCKAAEAALDKTDFEALLALMTAANEALGKAFNESGSGVEGDHTTPSQDLDQRARALMKADDSLEYADAVTKVFSSDPDLYNAYRLGA